MPEGELRESHSMGAEAMRITVVGALLIVAVVIVLVLVVRARNTVENDPPPDQWQQLFE